MLSQTFYLVEPHQRSHEPATALPTASADGNISSHLSAANQQSAGGFDINTHVYLTAELGFSTSFGILNNREKIPFSSPSRTSLLNILRIPESKSTKREGKKEPSKH